MSLSLPVVLFRLPLLHRLAHDTRCISSVPRPRKLLCFWAPPQHQADPVHLLTPILCASIVKCPSQTSTHTFLPSSTRTLAAFKSAASACIVAGGKAISTHIIGLLHSGLPSSSIIPFFPAPFLTRRDDPTDSQIITVSSGDIWIMRYRSLEAFVKDGRAHLL